MQTSYRGYKITRDGTDGFAAIFGCQWFRIYSPSGSLLGGSGGSLARAKRFVDDHIREAGCLKATDHKPVIERGDKQYCSHCGCYRGTVPKPGQGSKVSYYSNAANGHSYGWTTTRDRLGKWYAVDFNPRAQRDNRTRLVKCATRAKAKAKATEWWFAACNKKEVAC